MLRRITGYGYRIEVSALYGEPENTIAQSFIKKDLGSKITSPAGGGTSSRCKSVTDWPVIFLQP